MVKIAACKAHEKMNCSGHSPRQIFRYNKSNSKRKWEESISCDRLKFLWQFYIQCLTIGTTKYLVSASMNLLFVDHIFSPRTQLPFIPSRVFHFFSFFFLVNPANHPVQRALPINIVATSSLLISDTHCAFSIRGETIFTV